MFPTLKLHLIFFSLLFLLLISDPLVHLSLGPSLLQLLIFSWSWSLHYFNISSFQSQKPILYYIKLWIKPGQVTHICIYTIFKTPIGNILSLIYNQELYLSRTGWRGPFRLGPPRWNMLWDRVGQASANGASVTEKKEDKMPQNGKKTVTGIGISIGLVKTQASLYQCKNRV